MHRKEKYLLPGCSFPLFFPTLACLNTLWLSVKTVVHTNEIQGEDGCLLQRVIYLFKVLGNESSSSAAPGKCCSTEQNVHCYLRVKVILESMLLLFIM